MELTRRIFVSIILCYFRLCLSQDTLGDNDALFEYITTELLLNEDAYYSLLPENISYSFDVTFVFPSLKWSSFLEQPESDDYNCFTGKIGRTLKNLYYANITDFIEARVLQYRKYFRYKLNDDTVNADFRLLFKTEILQLNWNRTEVRTLFSSKFAILLDVFPFPPVNASKKVIVDYNSYYRQWFSYIANETSMFGYDGTFAYFGFYNETDIKPSYNGPNFFSLLNMVLYLLVGFNIFVIFAALIFWLVTGDREKLLLRYWIPDNVRIRHKTPHAF